MRSLVLASTAAHRAALLARLGIPFTPEAPQCEELVPEDRPYSAREASDLGLENARRKAESLRGAHPGAIILAADQVCECDGRIFGKPETSARAIDQLRALAGKEHRLHNGLYCLDADDGRAETALVVASLRMRALSFEEIVRYVERERPLRSCGGYLSEGVGVALFSHMDAGDPGAIVGLPLLATAELLRGFGLDPLGAGTP
ncbi:MAG: Maf family protein [Candidatus Eisenbacteria bacterium]|nr:Maf family protein [Candidatus Eisenbacteria bacterium]